MRSPARVKGGIPKRSRRTYRRPASPGSSRRMDDRYTHLAGTAGRGGVHGAGCAGRSAILAPRFHFVPEPADLSAARGAGEGHLAVSFRAARGRHSAAGHIGNRRRRRRPLRGDFQAGAALSAHRPQPAGRVRLLRSAGEGAAGAGAGRVAAPRPLAPGGSGGAVPAPGDGSLCAGRGADQPQIRMPLFARPDRPLSAGAAGTADARSARHGPRGHADQAAVGDPAGHAGERAGCGPRRPDTATAPWCRSASPCSRHPQRGEELLLVCFIDEPRAEHNAPDRAGAGRMQSARRRDWSRNWKPRGQNCKAPFATWRFPTRSRRRSTKRRCRSRRNINRRTRSC